MEEQPHNPEVHFSWYGSQPLVLIKTHDGRSQWAYINDPKRILKILRFCGITRRDQELHAIIWVLTEDGVRAIECPWPVYRQLDGAEAAAGVIAWEDAEALYREEFKKWRWLTISEWWRRLTISLCLCSEY